MRRAVFVVLAALLIGRAGLAEAQPLGTFRWQLRPFCNVVTVAVTQNGAVYRLEGTDDQCGNGADAASVTGTAFPNPDGTIGFGLNIVTTPGGRPLHVDAEITTGTFSGTWRDSAGALGTFVLTPGAGNGGTPRPLPSAVPSTIVLRPDGGFVAGGTERVGTIPAEGAGNRMMWYPSKAAFRAGEAVGSAWDDSNIGYGSVALGNSPSATANASFATGLDTIATGPASTAMGNAARATGPSSTATGNDSLASGNTSTAMGSSTTAEGANSFAIGSRTIARGSTSTAMGSSTTADGPNSLAGGSSTVATGSASTALGSSTVSSGPSAFAGGASSVASGSTALAFGLSTRAIGASSVALGRGAVANNGSFVFADGASNTDVSSGTNQFFVRASGGVAFFSNAGSTLGVQLVAGGSQWLSLSDARTKQHFRELDGDDVLARIARLPVREWSYKEQDAAIRHIGPTAQDFHAAFGLGEDPLRIGTLDADGVALAGVQAVEARTRRLSERLAALETENADLQAALAGARVRVTSLSDENAAIRDRLARLERLLLKQ